MAKLLLNILANGEYTQAIHGSHVPHMEQKSFVTFYGMSSDAATRKHLRDLRNTSASEGREVPCPRFSGKDCPKIYWCPVLALMLVLIG